MNTSASVDNGLIERGGPDAQVWQGVSLMLDQYLRLKHDDQVLILYARNARRPAAWVAAELNIREVPAVLADLDTLSEATITSFADKLRRSLDPKKIAARLLVK